MLFLPFSALHGQVVGSNFIATLRLVQGNDSTETVVYFDLNLSDTINLNSDAMLFPGSGPNVYSRIGTTKLAINAMGPLNQEKVVNIGYSLVNNQTCKLRLSDPSAWFGNAILELKDLSTNITTNLLQQSTYQFTSASGEFNQRFQLRVKPPANAYGILSGCTGQNSKIIIENFSGTPANYVLTDGNLTTLDSGIVNNDTIQTGNLPIGFYFIDFTVAGQNFTVPIQITLPIISTTISVITPDTLWDVDGGIPVAFTGFYTNLSANDSVYWDFGDGSAIEGWPWYINTVFHTYTSPGSYCAVATGSNGQCTASDTVCLVAYTITGMQNHQGNPPIWISEGKVWFNQLNSPAQFIITDVRGRMVSSPTNVATHCQNADLPSNVEAGIYFVRLTIPGLPSTIIKWCKN